MGWFWSFWALILLLGVKAKANYAEEIGKTKTPPAVVIVGTVYCDTCFHYFPNKFNFIAGASVAVECNDTSPHHPTFRPQVMTNSHGEFRVRLPPSIAKHIKKIKKCSVRLVRTHHRYCGVSATATSSSNLHLKSRKGGTHILSAGFFTFKPLDQPQLCDQKPSIDNIKKGNKLPMISHPNDLSFPPPIQDPEPPGLGSWLPQLPPLPTLPRLPPLPRLPGFPPVGGLSENAVARPMDLPLPQNPPLGIPPILPLPSLPPPIPASTPPVSVPGFLGVPPVEVPAPTNLP